MASVSGDDSHAQLGAPPSVPHDARVQDLVRRQLERQPDAPAVVDASATWTYRQLWQHAQRVSVQLRRVGVAPGSLVGVLLGRSNVTIASVLGVLLAGGGYVAALARAAPCGGYARVHCGTRHHAHLHREGTDTALPSHNPPLARAML